MTNFIRDNTSLFAAKSDYRTSSVSDDQKVTADNINKLRQALLDIQTYLRSGELDASITVTAKDIDVVNNTSPSVGPEVDWAGQNGRWFVGVDVANAETSRDFVITGLRQDYSFSDGVTTSGSPTLTSASHGGFTSALVGKSISGAGIPNGTTISAVGSATSLTMSANATATATGVRVTIVTGASQDLMYWRHRGALAPTLGIGVTPPDGKARLEVSPTDTEPAMEGVRIRKGPSQTGNIFTIHDSTPTDRLWVESSFWVNGLHPSGGALLVRADATNNRAVVMSKNQTTLFGYEFLSDSLIAFKCTSSGSASYNVQTDGSLQHTGAKFGAFSATPVVKPTVTGSRGGNAALASLITALATIGWITDSTTA